MNFIFAVCGFKLLINVAKGSQRANINLHSFCLNILFCCCLLTLSSYLRRLPESEVEEENKPLKLPGVLSTMTGTVMYPDEESAKWDVDGMDKVWLLLYLGVSCYIMTTIIVFSVH